MSTKNLAAFAIVLLFFLLLFNCSVQGTSNYAAEYQEDEGPIINAPWDPPPPPPLPGPPGSPSPPTPIEPIIRPIEDPPSAFPDRTQPTMPIWPPPEPPTYNEIPDMWFNVTPKQGIVGEEIDVTFTLVGMNASDLTMYYKPVGEKSYRSEPFKLTMQTFIWGFNYPYGFYYRDIQVWEGTIPPQQWSGYMESYWVAENGTERAVFPDTWAIPYLFEIIDIHPPEYEHEPVSELPLEQTKEIKVTASDDVQIWKVILWWKKVGEKNETRLEMNKVEGGIKNGTWNFTLPAQSNFTSLKYRFMISDGYNKVYFPNSGYQSVRTVDPYPPVISHEPVNNGSVLFSTEIEANVTDNVVVSSVHLFYKMTSESNYTRLEMSITEGDFKNGSYKGTIPRMLKTTMVEYYIQAEGLGEVSFFPSDPSQPITLHIRDSTPPMILHSPPKVLLENKSFRINAKMIDDQGIKSAFIYYKEPGDKEWNRMGLTLFSSDATQGIWFIEMDPIPVNGTFTYYLAGNDGFQTSLTKEYDIDIVPSPTLPERSVVEDDDVRKTPFPWDWVILSLMLIAGLAVVIYEFIKKVLYKKNIHGRSSSSTIVK